MYTAMPQLRLWSTFKYIYNSHSIIQIPEIIIPSTQNSVIIYSPSCCSKPKCGIFPFLFLKTFNVELILFHCFHCSVWGKAVQTFLKISSFVLHWKNKRKTYTGLEQNSGWTIPKKNPMPHFPWISSIMCHATCPNTNKFPVGIPSSHIGNSRY